MIHFVDTSTLLLLGKNIDKIDRLCISSITLEELEDIKNNKNKSPHIQYLARQVGEYIWNNFNSVCIEMYNPAFDINIKEYDLCVNNDARIIYSAFQINQNTPVKFLTSDINCAILAKSIFALDVELVKDDFENNYAGYKLLSFNNETDLAEWYHNISDDHYEFLTNEYVLLENKDGIIDKYKQNKNGKLESVQYVKFKSKQFGEIKPKDEFQACAMDSLMKNQFTILRGSAGTGKSLLSLSCLFHKLEKGDIDKIIIFCNPVAVRNAAKLGFYPGDRLEKLLDSQIGNFLKSKIGAEEGVLQLIDHGLLELLPVADIRGYDTTGMKAGILVTEAQNLSVDIAKLLIQRVGEDSILIMEGDTDQQVDMNEYAGYNNGMIRAIEIFKNNDCFGTITLPNIYRSKIAKIADKM